MKRLRRKCRAISITLMSGETDRDFWVGSVSAVLIFIIAPLALILFNAMTQGQDAVITLLTLVAFTACILYGEANLSLPSGLAFGIGICLPPF
jgi:hypothetical protein